MQPNKTVVIEKQITYEDIPDTIKKLARNIYIRPNPLKVILTLGLIKKST